MRAAKAWPATGLMASPQQQRAAAARRKIEGAATGAHASGCIPSPAAAARRRLRHVAAALLPQPLEAAAAEQRPRLLRQNTVGVVRLDASRASAGYTLFSSGMENYLIDLDGRQVHKWTASRGVNVAYLLPNGDILRDGSEDTVNTLFRAGGAAGYVERVSWEGERVWGFSYQPYDQHLTHHDIEYMPNGHVLLLAWNRRETSQAVAAGRRPELLPEGQLWIESVIEIAPNGRGGCDIVWEVRRIAPTCQRALPR